MACAGPHARFRCLIRPLPPPQPQHSARAAGWALPDRDFHPPRHAGVFLAHSGLELPGLTATCACGPVQAGQTAARALSSSRPPPIPTIQVSRQMPPNPRSTAGDPYAADGGSATNPGSPTVRWGAPILPGGRRVCHGRCPHEARVPHAGLAYSLRRMQRAPRMSRRMHQNSRR